MIIEFLPPSRIDMVCRIDDELLTLSIPPTILGYSYAIVVDE